MATSMEPKQVFGPVNRNLKLDGVLIAGTKHVAVDFTDEDGGEGVEGVDSLYVSPGEWCSRWCIGRAKWWRG